MEASQWEKVISLDLLHRIDSVSITWPYEWDPLLFELRLIVSESYSQIVLVAEEHGNRNLHILVGIDDPARREQSHALETGNLEAVRDKRTTAVEWCARHQAHTVAA